MILPMLILSSLAGFTLIQVVYSQKSDSRGFVWHIHHEV